MSDNFKQMILDLVNSDEYEPMRSKEMARALGVSKGEYKYFRDAVGILKHEGKLARERGSRWSARGKGSNKLVTGTLRINRSGGGFLLPDDTSIDDIFVGDDYLGSALDGDKVQISVDTPRGRGFRHFGRVEQVVERGSPRLVAIVGADYTARPEDPKNPFDYIIEDRPENLRPDTKVLLETTVFPGSNTPPAGRVIEILGPAGKPDTETAAILASYNAPGPFPQEVKDEVYAYERDSTMDDRSNRLDLTKQVCVTIDPDTARDFDDALSYRLLEDGNIEIGVHIADVSHFVRPGNELDKEAHERSTSIYLPGRVIPMLPEELSNDLCSLRPNEDRFTKTVFIKYTPDGKVVNYHIHRSVIHSHRRMTYNEVKVLLEDESAAAAFDDQELLQSLRGMNELAKTLRANRMENGSIELNMTDFIILLDEEGNVTGMRPAEHDFSHELVEEFMLAANCCVAQWCHTNGIPALHRNHDAPDEVATDELADFLNASGYVFKPPFKREKLQRVIEQAKGKPEEHAINLAILKSFKQAVYGPAGDVGHFALNFPNYMHFTSPIRRYPDLHLHQQLDKVFGKGENKLPKKLLKAGKPGGKALEALGLHCSGQERKAMKIEEAVKDFLKLEFLSRNEQREFVAVITGIRKFGVFVEIEDYFVEGMLPRWMVEKMGYTTKEVKPGKQGGIKGFHLGQEVRVKITKIDLPARTCEMQLLDVLKSPTLEKKK